jgi:methionyl-tRNA formyltransferase
MTNSSALRIIFAGTPTFAAAHLQALLNWDGGNVIAVYTKPDRPGKKPSEQADRAVKDLALNNGLPVLQPDSLRNIDAQEELRSLNADIMVVVAYGQILPAEVLTTPRLGCVNVHGSILPRWRGAAPIQRAIEAGDKETGVTIMQMDEGIDTGAMLSIVRCPITRHDTTITLYDKLAAIGAPALLQTLQELAEHRAKPQAQDNQLSCLAKKIKKEEAKIDWNQSADTIDRRIRAFISDYGTYGWINGHRVKIHQAEVGLAANAAPGEIVSEDRKTIVVACGEHSTLRILELQFDGGKILAASQAMNGRAELFKPGAYFDVA